MLVIDTRSPMEYQMGHVNGAVNIPPEKFMAGGLPAELADVAKDEEIIVYCLSGSRSNVVKQILGQLGYSNVTNGINKGHVEKLLAS